jgi:FixJ family two-component response regulator
MEKREVNSVQLVAVVDDDASFRAALEDLLLFAGFRVQAYDSAEALLSSGRIGSFDGFLLDVQMPGKSGLDLIGDLRRAGIKAPVLFVTSRDDQRTRDRAFAAGAAGMVGKPFEPDNLLDLLRGAMSQAG